MTLNRIDKSMIKGLPEDLNSLTTQLAQKAEKGDISVLDIDKNKGKFDQTYMTDEFLQQIVGNTPINTTVAPKSLTSVQFSKNAVTENELGLLKKSTNLIDASKITPSKSYNASGVIIDSAYHLTDYIPIEPNKQYSSSKVFFKTYFDSNYNFIVRTGEEVTFTTPSNAYFVRASIAPIFINTEVRINEGSTLKPFEPYYSYLPPKLIEPLSIPIDNLLGNRSVGIDKVDFVNISTNLYNYETVTPDMIVETSGNVVPSTSMNDLSDFIAVKPNTSYAVKGSFSLVSYSNNKSFINRITIPTSGHVFTTSANTHYVRLIMTRPNTETTQLNIGSSLLTYEPYYIKLRTSLLPDSVGSKNVFFNPEMLQSRYENKLTNAIKFETVSDFNSAFETLVNQHPSYLSRIHKGKDQSGLYDIYEYSAKPTELPMTDYSKKLPKLVLVAGLHGGEKTSIFNMYYLIKDICENWRNDKALEYLRWNVDIVFNPLANPWAFENGNGRHNVNGVDLNRNFSAQWSGNLTGAEYSGTAPFSEKESQYVRDMFNENTDALFAGDYHTNGSTVRAGYAWDIMLWVSLGSGKYKDENLSIAAKNTIEKMTRDYIKNYNLPNDVGYFGKISYANVSGAAKTYASSIGIPACTFESFMSMPDESEWFTERTIKASTDYLGTWLLTLLTQFKNNQ